jgi:hypothetical protein
VHVLERSNPKWDGWIDATHMGDDEFHALIVKLQTA